MAVELQCQNASNTIRHPLIGGRVRGGVHVSDTWSMMARDQISSAGSQLRWNHHGWGNILATSFVRCIFVMGSVRIKTISGVPRGVGRFKPPSPPRNSEGPPKSCQTEPDWENCLKIAEFRTPTPQDVRKKGSKILKLPPGRNCFTLAMTNKLLVCKTFLLYRL